MSIYGLTILKAHRPKWLRSRAPCMPADAAKVQLVCANGLAEEAAHSPGIARRSTSAPFFDIWLRDTGPIIIRNEHGHLALGCRSNGWGGKYPSPLDEHVAEILCAQSRHHA